MHFSHQWIASRVTGAAMSAALLFAATLPASADTTFNDNAVHALNTTIAPSVIVSATTGHTTTLNVGTGASVTGGNEIAGIRVNAGGLVNVSGGVITGGIVNSGGGANGISINGGTVNISGGNLNGGSVTAGGGAPAVDLSTGTLSITGGTFHAGTVNAGGGADCVAVFGGTATISGGDFTTGAANGGAFVGVGGSITITGGTIHAPAGNSPAMVTESTGHITIWNVNLQGGPSSGNNDFLAQGGIIDLYGGTITTGSLAKTFLMEKGTVNIYGSNFNLPFGSITSGAGMITGTLSDGSPFSSTYQFLPPQASTINLISFVQTPEPSSVALLVLGSATLIRRRVSSAKNLGGPSKK